MTRIDIVIIAAYFLGMLVIGVVANRKQKGVEDYYVAGRKQGTFSIMSLWLCGWVGGSTIIGGSGLAYEIGIGGVIVPFAEALGLLIFALTISGKINKMGFQSKFLTYPDMIEARYDRRSALIATITTILSYIAFIASQLAAGASIVSALTGWELGRTYVICAIVVIVYTALGGYLAVTFTDWFQMLLIMAGVVFITFPVTAYTITPAELSASLPASFWDISRYGSTSTILGLILSTVFAFYTSMDSYTRMFAAKSEKAARRGSLLTVVLLAAIAVAVMYMGMAAHILLPGIEDSSQTIARLMVHLLPPGLQGLLIVGILSAIMSTADISILTGSSNLTNDLYHKHINKKASSRHLLYFGMGASLVLGALAALLAWYKQNIIDIIYIAYTLSAANLFIPTVCGFFWKRGSARASFYSMLLSLAAVLTWYLVPAMGYSGGLFAFDPVWPGLAVSAVVYFTVSLTGKPSREEEQKIAAFTA